MSTARTVSETYAAYLRSLQERDLLRKLRTIPAGCVDFASNDYLGLARTGLSLDASAWSGTLDAGSGASRLVSGTKDLHVEVENELATRLGFDAAVLTSSGYVANVGLLQALSSVPIHIFSDALNHASIVDGCRLAHKSGADVTVFRHADSEHLSELLAANAPSAALSIVAIESIYSMDGDVPDFQAFAEVCARHGAALIIDHTHGFGLEPLLPQLQEVTTVADIVVLGFGKALGLFGGAVVASDPIVETFKNRARGFVYSTATPPWHAALVRDHVRWLGSSVGAATVTELGANQQQMRSILHAAGLTVPQGTHLCSPILPVVIGESAKALAVSESLLAQNVFVPAIRTPTVPEGTARLRFTVSSRYSQADFKTLENALQRL